MKNKHIFIKKINAISLSNLFNIRFVSFSTDVIVINEKKKREVPPFVNIELLATIRTDELMWLFPCRQLQAFVICHDFMSV